MLVWKPGEVDVERSEILRYLGYGSEKGKLSSRISEILDNEMERAFTLISPRGYYRVVKAEALSKMEIFYDAERLAFSVVTIGSGIEDKVKELFAAREELRAVLLNAVGTVITKKAGNMAYREICREVVPSGYHMTRPFGPGNGNWSLDGQKLVFRFLNETVMEKMGITLASSLLIMPLKSVSFAAKLGRHGMKEIVSGERCNDCLLGHKCSFRDLQ